MKRRFLFLLMAAFAFVGANASINRANNYLKANATTATAGQTVVVDLIMKNSFDIAMWTTTFVLPEGVTVESATAADRWTAEVKAEGNVVSSETETPVAAGEGVVAKVTLKVDASVAAGDYTIQLFPMKMVASNETIIDQVDSQSFTLTVEENPNPIIKGDANGDGEVNVMDVVRIYDIMSGNAESNAAADVNGDGEVNVMDVVAVYDIMAGN